MANDDSLITLFRLDEANDTERLHFVGRPSKGDQSRSQLHHSGNRHNDYVLISHEKSKQSKSLGRSDGRVYDQSGKGSYEQSQESKSRNMPPPDPDDETPDAKLH